LSGAQNDNREAGQKQICRKRRISIAVFVSVTASVWALTAWHVPAPMADSEGGQRRYEWVGM
jgi:hypothetical protein